MKSENFFASLSTYCWEKIHLLQEDITTIQLSLQIQLCIYLIHTEIPEIISLFGGGGRNNMCV